MSRLEVHQFPCLSDNYGYLVHDPDSGLTATIDTPEVEPIHAALDARGWKLNFIFNTHHHDDHAGGKSKKRRKGVNDRKGGKDPKGGKGDPSKPQLMKPQFYTFLQADAAHPSGDAVRACGLAEGAGRDDAEGEGAEGGKGRGCWADEALPVGREGTRGCKSLKETQGGAAWWLVAGGARSDCLRTCQTLRKYLH